MHRSIPPIKGMILVDTRIDKGMIVQLLRHDEAANADLETMLLALSDPVNNLSLEPRAVAAAASRLIIRTACANCGHTSFERRFRVAGSPKRVVDTLHCLDCRKSLRVNADGDCEGLMPTVENTFLCREAISRFKRKMGCSSELDE